MFRTNYSSQWAGLSFSNKKPADALARDSHVVGENGPAEIKNSFGEIKREIE
jgi:hypothetical protein